MQTFTEIRAAQLAQPTVLTIGNFDGIHRGHQALLQTLVRRAGELDALPGIITFDPHPVRVLRPTADLKLLTTPWERLYLAERHGVEVGVVQPFTTEVVKLSPREFMQLLKTHLNVVGLVVGPDFALGRNRSGDLPVLRQLGQELGYTVTVIEPVDWQGHSVRSSEVRNFLVQGDVQTTRALLGRAYHVTGVVVEGDRRGRQIGVPTANMELASDKLLPADGVYATRTYVHADTAPALAEACSTPLIFNSATNIGMRPTVGGLEHRFESHLLDFPTLEKPNDLQLGNLYGCTLTVEFVAWLRGERRFDGIDALVSQIHTDIGAAREILPPISADTGTTAFANQAPFFLQLQPD